MYKGSVNLVSELLLALGMGKYGYPVPFEDNYDFLKRMRKTLTRKEYYDTVYKLKKRGVLTVVRKNGQRFLRMTAKGELEQLLAKVAVDTSLPWDGKWRIITFDIPADPASNVKRDKLRRLLKKQHFHMEYCFSSKPLLLPGFYSKKHPPLDSFANSFSSKG